MTNYVEAGKNSRKSHQHPVTGAAVRSEPFHEGTRTHMVSGVSGTCLHTTCSAVSPANSNTTSMRTGRRERERKEKKEKKKKHTLAQPVGRFV